jgi:hypothetical protein
MTAAYPADDNGDVPDQPARPDPALPDDERSQAARRRGLEAPYIAGGRDPDPERGRREERFYLRLLIAMIVAIVLGGYVLGFIGQALGLPIVR